MEPLRPARMPPSPFSPSPAPLPAPTFLALSLGHTPISTGCLAWELVEREREEGGIQEQGSMPHGPTAADEQRGSSTAPKQAASARIQQEGGQVGAVASPTPFRRGSPLSFSPFHLPTTSIHASSDLLVRAALQAFSPGRRITSLAVLSHHHWLD